MRKYLRKTSLLRISGAILSGFIISYLCFSFFHGKLHLSILTAVCLSTVITVTLIILITVSKRVKCVVLLMLPQLFSKRGRAALIAYAFLLVMSGPFRNTCTNIEDLSRSLSCAQEELKKAVEDLIGVLKVPFLAIKQVIKNVLVAFDGVFEKIRKILMRIRILVMSVSKVIKRGFSWLGGIVSICNKKIGTPFQRCERMFDEAVKNCRIQLGAMSALCDVTYLVKAFCYTVKFLDYICELVDFISDAILGTIEKQIDKFINEIKTIFYVSVTFDHQFNFQTNSSRNLSSITSAVNTEIYQRTKHLFLYLDVLSLITGLFFLWMFLRALYYKHKYLTSTRFDNHYLNDDFFAIDKRRKLMHKESVLPLTRKESRKYVKLTALKIVSSERKKIFKLSIFLFITSFKLGSLLAIDFCLYWLLAAIRFYGLQTADLEIEPNIVMTLNGTGFIADLYEGVINAFKPITMIDYNIDPVLCLPKPSRPNLGEYVDVGLLVGFCWGFLILEPFGLRLRQVVMAHYFPDETKIRTLWLYDQILIKRSDFIKLARRNMRLFHHRNSGQFERRTFLDVARAKTNNFWIMRKILGIGSAKTCMLCGSVLKSEDEIAYCMRPGCPGRYCFECYVELKNTCSLCMEPIEYGDLSDFSEENGSSDNSDYTENIEIGLVKNNGNR